MGGFNLFQDNRVAELLDAVAKFNESKDAKNYEVKIKDKLLKKKADKFSEKDIDALQEILDKSNKEIAIKKQEAKEAKEKAEAEKVKEAEEKAKELQEAKDYLTKEGVSFENKKDKDIISLAKTTAENPKYPFHVRIFGDNQEAKFNFEEGKKYSLEAIKEIVVKEYFELKKADFEFDKERNTVYTTIKSSQKG